MKVKTNNLIQDLSGRYGDNVFARNASGLYVRVHADAEQPNSERQSIIKQHFTTYSTRWATLDDMQRSGWNRLAAQVGKTGRFGDLYHPSGHRLYLAVNTTRAELALASLDQAPAFLPAIAPIPGFAPSLGILIGGDVELKLGSGATPLASPVLVYATPTQSPGRSVIGKSEYRLIGTVAAGVALNVNQGQFYVDKFDLPTEGRKVGIKLVPVTNGFQGLSQRALVTVL